ncbi:hypothetical protein GCM10010517_52870 [Streptosporangium fragile]|uniref:Lipoprotein n=1 Tax=Streptosporangium fragile TaxID=46186 RepID=A0ABN3W3J7_9ACTN
MRRRLLALIVSLSLTAGCGARAGDQAAIPEPEPARETSAGVELDEAIQAFEVLRQLDDAWRERDCAAIGKLTAWVENALGGRACEATRNGRPAPERKSHSEVEFFLPGPAGQDRWFLALAREPDPAYFLFVEEGGGWRLGAGPIPVRGEPPEPVDGAVPPGDPGVGVRARLAPQRYLTYLTDPAGVSGVTFPKGDAARGLLDELTGRPGKVRPDRLDTDVRLLVGPERALLLPGGGALVVHAVEIEYRQRAAPGRSAPAHPLYTKADLRGFTGETRAAEVTGTEVVVFATEVTDGAGLSTVGLRRGLADLATG